MPITGVTSSSGGRKPTAPTIGSATAGNASASVAFTVPTYLGKPSNNNLYTATSSPGNTGDFAFSGPDMYVRTGNFWYKFTGLPF